MKPLAVGLALGGPVVRGDFGPALRLAEWSDAHGLHSLWLPEGHFRPGATASPLLGLAAFAARTTRIRLATTSLLLSVHDARRIAADVATLDQLSGGRVVLGVGRGFEKSLFRAFGVDPRDKRDRLDAALDAILTAWAGSAREGMAPDLPLPVQKPHPPIVVAAFGPKGLAQAARRGLPYLASPIESLDALEQNYAAHVEQLPAGVDARSVGVPIMRTVHVAGSQTEADQILEAIDAEFARMASVRGPTLARKAMGGAAARVIVGDAAAVADSLAAYRERTRMDLLVVRPAPAVGEASRLRSLEALLEIAATV